MTHQMNLLHLKYFCDAVIYNSISEAAKMNFITQSAVSQAITKLEVSLGVQLVIHTRQKFQVTEEGKIIFEQAGSVFKAIQEIHHKINENKATITGDLKFVSTNSLGMSFIAPMYQKMRMAFPHIRMHYRLGGLNFIRNALQQGEAEFAIVVYDQNFAVFNKRLLKRGLFHLYFHLEAPQHVLENGILVDYLESMYVNELHEYFIQASGQQLKIQAELASWEVVARFTEMKIGIGFFPDYIMANNRYPNLSTYPIDLPSFDYEICAIYNKDQKLSRAASAFLDQFSLNEET